MGYGKRALSLLIQYYEGKIPNLSEEKMETKDLEIEPTDIDEVWSKNPKDCGVGRQ